MNRAIVTIKNETFWAEDDLIWVRKNHFATLFRAGVLREAEEEQYAIVSALTFEMSLDECNRVNCELRGKGVDAAISFHIADGEGWAEVIAGLDQGFDLFSVAAAVGVIKASCGWDESPMMAVRVNGADVTIRPRFEDGEWIATTPTV